MSMQESYTLERDNLFAATQMMPVVADEIEIPSGTGQLKRGSLLTAEGKLVKKTVEPEPASTTFDAVYAVLAQDVDATSAAVKAAVFLTGEFNEAAMIVDTANSATVADFKVSARNVGIFIKKNL